MIITADEILRKLAKLVVESEKKHIDACRNGTTPMQVGTEECVRCYQRAFAAALGAAVDSDVYYSALKNYSLK